MRRNLMTLAVVGLFGSLLLASDASACCHKRKACAQPCVATCPAPAPCPEPAPCPAPVACAPAKKCCFGGFKMRGLCHKRQQACYAPVACYAPAPQAWVAPSGQYPSGQY